MGREKKTLMSNNSYLYLYILDLLKKRDDELRELHREVAKLKAVANSSALEAFERGRNWNDYTKQQHPADVADEIESVIEDLRRIQEIARREDEEFHQIETERDALAKLNKTKSSCPACNATDPEDVLLCNRCGKSFCWKCGSPPEGFCGPCGERVND